jgi:hypothetical protein
MSEFAVLWRKRHKGRKVIGRAVMAAFLVFGLAGKAADACGSPHVIHGKVNGRVFYDTFGSINECGLPELTILKDLIRDAAHNEWPNPAVFPVSIKLSTAYRENSIFIKFLSGRDHASISESALVALNSEFTDCAGLSGVIANQRKLHVHFEGRCAPNVCNSDINISLSVGCAVNDPPKIESLNSEIGDNKPRSLIANESFPCEPQLLRATKPEFIGGAPQQPRKYQEARSEDGKQRIGNFQANTEERRPKFGSLIVALLGMFPAVLLIRFGGVLRTTLGIVLALESIVGLLLGVDLWSLLHWAI